MCYLIILEIQYPTETPFIISAMHMMVPKMFCPKVWKCYEGELCFSRRQWTCRCSHYYGVRYLLFTHVILSLFVEPCQVSFTLSSKRIDICFVFFRFCRPKLSFVCLCVLFCVFLPPVLENRYWVLCVLVRWPCYKIDRKNKCQSSNERTTVGYSI